MTFGRSFYEQEFVPGSVSKNWSPMIKQGAFMEMVLTAVFEEVPESDGGGYVTYVEELPGAISQGETLDEARENLRDAIALLLAA
jgi:predicted RNase H-like HicB family nuclease